MYRFQSIAGFQSVLYPHGFQSGLYLTALFHEKDKAVRYHRHMQRDCSKSHSDIQYSCYFRKRNDMDCPACCRDHNICYCCCSYSKDETCLSVNFLMSFYSLWIIHFTINDKRWCRYRKVPTPLFFCCPYQQKFKA